MSRRHKETDTQATQSQQTEPAVDSRPDSMIGSETIIKQTIEGLEATRKRPSIFIGDTSIKGLHHLVSEVVDSCVSQAMKDCCNDSHILNLFDKSEISTTKRKKHLHVSNLFSGVGGLSGKIRTGKTSLANTLCHILGKKDQEEPDLILATEEEETPRKKGRPIIKRLCSKFSDASIWPMVKNIYQKIYNYSIQKATNLTQYLVCFICGLFRVNDTDEVDGHISHFHRIVKEYISKSAMPSIRKLQQGVQWLRDKKQIWFRSLKDAARDKEEARHKKWEIMEDQIYRMLQEVAPQYAMM